MPDPGNNPEFPYPYCPYCGKEVLDPNHKFCWSCGKEYPKP